MEAASNRVIYVDYRAQAPQEYTRENPPKTSGTPGLKRDHEGISTVADLPETDKTICSLLSTFSSGNHHFFLILFSMTVPMYEWVC